MRVQSCPRSHAKRARVLRLASSTGGGYTALVFRDRALLSTSCGLLLPGDVLRRLLHDPVLDDGVAHAHERVLWARERDDNRRQEQGECYCRCLHRHDSERHSRSQWRHDVTGIDSAYFSRYSHVAKTKSLPEQGRVVVPVRHTGYRVIASTRVCPQLCLQVDGHGMGTKKNVRVAIQAPTETRRPRWQWGALSSLQAVSAGLL